MILSGCSLWTLPNEGGMITSTATSKSITEDKDGKKSSVERSISVSAKQPDNPGDKIQFHLDAEKGTAESELPSSILPELPSQVDLSLGRVVLMGGILIIVGGLMAAFFNIKWGIIVGVTGIATMAIAVAIGAAQGILAWIIGIAFVLGLGYAIIMALHWYRDNKALKQTTEAIEDTKEKDPSTWEKLEGKLKESQDLDVKKHIDKIINKLKK